MDLSNHVECCLLYTGVESMTDMTSRDEIIHFPMRWSIIILDHSSSRDLHSIVGNRIMVLVLVVFVSVFVDIRKSKTSSCASTTSNFPASSLPTLTWSYFCYSTLSLY